MSLPMQRASDIIFEVYWPRLIDQYCDVTIFDTEDDKKFKKALRKKLESLTQEEAQEWLKTLTEVERRARYEAMREEFE